MPNKWYFHTSRSESIYQFHDGELLIGLNPVRVGYTGRPNGSTTCRHELVTLQEGGLEVSIDTWEDTDHLSLPDMILMHKEKFTCGEGLSKKAKRAVKLIFKSLEKEYF